MFLQNVHRRVYVVIDVHVVIFVLILHFKMTVPFVKTAYVVSKRICIN